MAAAADCRATVRWNGARDGGRREMSPMGFTGVQFIYFERPFSFITGERPRDKTLIQICQHVGGLPVRPAFCSFESTVEARLAHSSPGISSLGCSRSLPRDLTAHTSTCVMRRLAPQPVAASPKPGAAAATGMRPPSSRLHRRRELRPAGPQGRSGTDKSTT